MLFSSFEEMIKYRNNGAMGAILDEYEKALIELENVIADLTTDDLIFILDKETENPNCKSIQAILSHVIRAGYCYVIEIRKKFGERIEFVELKTYNTADQYITELRYMFKYCEQLFQDYPDMKLEELNPGKKIKVTWGQSYDVEQLFEHAIVHVLRHRRQIEKFLKKIYVK